MSFAIDISNPRIQNAMMNLGIEYDELVKAEIDDFYEKDAADEIVEMRFNYFNRKQQELIRKLKEFARETLVRELESKKKEEFSRSEGRKNSKIFETSFEAEIEKVREKHRKKISLTRLDMQKNYAELRNIKEKLNLGEIAREKNKEKVLEQREKMQKFKEKQLENLSKLKINERKNAKNARKCYSITPNRSIIRQKLSKSFYADTRDESSTIDDDIGLKILKYEEKMNKSRMIYTKNMESKRKAAQKLILRAEITSNIMKSKKQSAEEETLSKLIIKTNLAAQRRQNLLQEKNENRLKHRQEVLEKMDKATWKFKEQEKLSQTRAKAIEKRMEICDQIIAEKQNNWLKQLEFRNELQRLKDDEALNNAERKKRVM